MLEVEFLRFCDHMRFRRYFEDIPLQFIENKLCNNCIRGQKYMQALNPKIEFNAIELFFKWSSINTRQNIRSSYRNAIHNFTTFLIPPYYIYSRTCLWWQAPIIMYNDDLVQCIMMILANIFKCHYRRIPYFYMFHQYNYIVGWQ